MEGLYRLHPLPLVAALLFCQLGFSVQRSNRAEESDALVQSLYRQVLARHPTGLPRGADMKVFAPYLSKRLIHRIKLANACARDWVQQDQKRMLMSNQIPEKAPFGWAESGIFSGAYERTEPDAFVIKRTEAGKNDSVRVYVRLTLSSPPAETWDVEVVLVMGDGHLVVDDVIYLKDKSNDHDLRLSKLLSEGCDGSRWVGFPDAKNR